MPAAGATSNSSISRACTAGSKTRADVRAALHSAGPRLIICDEAQLVPELQLRIKELIDLRGAAASQFLLTGSARFNTRELGGSDPLTGRVRRLRLYPFSQ